MSCPGQVVLAGAADFVLVGGGVDIWVKTKSVDEDVETGKVVEQFCCIELYESSK
jgi:hypothetical protein